MPLRARLTIFFSAFLAVVLAVVAIAVYTLTERSLISSLEERALEALSEFKVGNYGRGLQLLPGDAYFEPVIYFPPFSPPLEHGQPYRQGLRVTQDFRPNPTDDQVFTLLSDRDFATVIDDGVVTSRVTLPNGRTLLVMASRADINIGGILYPGMVLVGLPADTVQATLAQLGLDLVRTVLFALALSALGVWLLSRQALAPVKRVTAVARVISGRDLSQRVTVPQTRDEMSELADTLNNMLDRLQESFETQRRFTADASHELRTPVTAIVGHTNYLLRRTKPTPEQVDSLTVIKREAERMAKLVNDLLELARADAGFSVERQPVNVVEVAEAVHMDLALSAGNVDIRVSSAQPVIEVLGDASRLKQVLLNLVQNAINAGAQQVAVSLAQERDAVRIEVLDNGPGIPAEAIPHLFDRFFRIDGARSGRGNGSGLGLAIVKWIVQQHQGEVLVESKLGEGTVFTVTLPAHSSKQTEARALTRPRTDRLPA
ncbi:MAG: HAMP domain-containing histidine kinase [Truepera sp.]|nr:HAMP domain-containing histidine kinase [Truepera sp.]